LSARFAKLLLHHEILYSLAGVRIIASYHNTFARSQTIGLENYRIAIDP